MSEGNRQHFNALSPAEDERLAILMEEMAEAIQVIGKILRHGYLSHDPTDPKSFCNRALLEQELGDVRHAIQRMVDAGDVNREMIHAYAQRKAIKIAQYLHHQPENSND